MSNSYNTRINMLFPIFIFSMLIGQAALGDPMRYGFEKVTIKQSTMYSILKEYTNMGKEPIFFPSSNTSADYASNVWMDPCYERFFEVGAYYVAYWYINEDMYCEALVLGTHRNYKPAFDEQYLARVEFNNTWCPPQN